MIAFLDMGVAARPAKKEVELCGEVSKGERELRAGRLRFSIGVDLRLLERGEMLSHRFVPECATRGGQGRAMALVVSDLGMEAIAI